MTFNEIKIAVGCFTAGAFSGFAVYKKLQKNYEAKLNDELKIKSLNLCDNYLDLVEALCNAGIIDENIRENVVKEKERLKEEIRNCKF